MVDKGGVVKVLGIQNCVLIFFSFLQAGMYNFVSWYMCACVCSCGCVYMLHGGKKPILNVFLSHHSHLTLEAIFY